MRYSIRIKGLILAGSIIVAISSFSIAEKYGSSTVFQGGWGRPEPNVGGRALGPPLTKVEEIRLGYEPAAKEPDAEGHREPADGPRNFEVDKDGNFYIVDYLKQRVVKFDKNGRYLFSFGKKDNEELYLKQPGGIAIDKKGNIYVSDSGYPTDCVLKFDSQGNFITKIDSVNGRKFTWITYLFSQYHNGNIYIEGEIEGREGKSLVYYEFDPESNFVRETKWLLEDKRGNTYQCKVVDGKPIDNTLEVVSSDGKVIKEIVVPLGQKEGEEPGCIWIDREGNSYFIDFAWGKRDEIFKYDNDGKLITRFKIKSLHTNILGMVNFKILPGGTIYQIHATDDGLSIIKYEPAKLLPEDRGKVN